MKTLPPFLNGTIDWLYNGAELHPLTEEHVKFITENLDVHYLLREEFSNRIKNEIFDPFDILKHKFGILVTVAQNLPNIPIRNVSLILLFEDLCKFIAISLSDITDKTLSLINSITSKYTCLFKKTPLKKLVEAQGNADPVRKNEYLACLSRHDQLSKVFFKFGLNEQGQPRAENFEEIRNDLFERRKIINDYRDRVAAHVDLKNPAYQPEWKDVKLYIDFLEEVISNLYFLSTYRSYGHPLGGAGIKSKETIEWFCKGISL